MFFERPIHDHNACIRLFSEFFVDANKLLGEFAPAGWESSPLHYAFHPTPQQRYEEALRLHRNLVDLFGQREGKPSKEPEWADFLELTQERAGRPAEEIVYLVGLCLWDTFSDNHQVIDRQGKVYDLGSFRGSGDFIAGYINDQFREFSSTCDYLDFYMGTLCIHHRTDLKPVYGWIFAHLEALECDWIYSFPRLGLVKLGHSTEGDDPLEYDPGEALARELERQQVDQLQQELDEAYREALEAARHEPLPEIVQAYRDVYGRLPEGWPHPQA